MHHQIQNINEESGITKEEANGNSGLKKHNNQN